MLLLLLAAGAAPTRIQVEASDLEGELERRIQAEIADVVIAGSNPDLTVSLRRDEGFVLVIRAGDAAEERTLPLEEGDEGALRWAVLLVARAIESLRSLDDPLELSPAPSDVTGYVTAGAATVWWWRPLTPQLAFAAGGGLELRAFEIGLLFVWMGEPCCVRRLRGLEADARELVFLADAGWTFVRWGPISGRLRASAGVDWIRTSATPRVYAGPTRPQTHATIEGVVRAGGSLDIEIFRDLLWFALAGGAWVRIAPVEVSLDPSYGVDSLFTGPIVPWAEGRLTLEIP
jgi:hypothetical protein